MFSASSVFQAALHSCSQEHLHARAPLDPAFSSEVRRATAFQLHRTTWPPHKLCFFVII